MAEKEYIEREAVLAYMSEVKAVCISNFEDEASAVIAGMIVEIKDDEIPAANVAPVRHGEWANEETAVTCTACGRSYDTDFEIKRNVIMNFTYCPKCGARMDGGEQK